jgi:hypothetical protein
VDPARPFAPANCRFATRAETARNARHPSSKMPPRWTLTVFGETKGPTEWSRDARCAVTLTSFLQRLRKGWDARSALTTPPQTRIKPPPRRLVTAFGQTKGVTDWARDRRCRVTLVTLVRRLDGGMPAEEAIRTPPFKRSSGTRG